MVGTEYYSKKYLGHVPWFAPWEKPGRSRDTKAWALALALCLGHNARKCQRTGLIPSPAQLSERIYNWVIEGITPEKIVHTFRRGRLSYASIGVWMRSLE